MQTKMPDSKSKIVLEYLKSRPPVSSKEVYEGLKAEASYATVKRILSQLVTDSFVAATGQGKATKYQLASTYELLYPVDVEEYFKKEIDEREIRENFNLTLIPEVLNRVRLFSKAEEQLLASLQLQYEQNKAGLTPSEYKNELERLAIDLSWKSSQIEGNTYSLLETERLLKEKETAQGKTKDEATMLLNHKEAIDFVVENPTYVLPLTVARIEDIHSLLIRDLGVSRNIRQRRVGISGTNYKPLDNEYQIREALNGMCELVNQRKSIFEKALLVLLLISYIQPFSDGNKRTARIISNAILIGHGYCPVSFRTVDSVEYKKAMLLFYEQNNLSAFKNIFIRQFEFAVKTYF